MILNKEGVFKAQSLFGQQWLAASWCSIENLLITIDHSVGHGGGLCKLSGGLSHLRGERRTRLLHVGGIGYLAWLHVVDLLSGSWLDQHHAWLLLMHELCLLVNNDRASLDLMIVVVVAFGVMVGLTVANAGVLEVLWLDKGDVKDQADANNKGRNPEIALKGIQDVNSELEHREADDPHNVSRDHRHVDVNFSIAILALSGRQLFAVHRDFGLLISSNALSHARGYDVEDHQDDPIRGSLTVSHPVDATREYRAGYACDGAKMFSHAHTVLTEIYSNLIL